MSYFCSGNKAVKANNMKYKKILLIVFLLTLFVFQQAQASAKAPFVKNLSQVNLAPLSLVSYQYLRINMYHLVNPGGAIADNPPVRCWTIGYIDPAFGCGTGDPQDSQIAHNPLLNLDVEQYYLKDVLPREMDVHTNDPALAALQAQAIAARSVATWKSIYQPDQHDPTSSDTHAINNSTEFQVYIPGAIDTYQNPRDPAGIKQNILDAVSLTTGQYLSYSGEPIDAEFASDAVNNTLDDPAAFPKSYLKRVEEPISSNDNALPVDCQAHNLGQLPAPNLNLLNGMSQKGAIRWSLGNQCAAGGDDSTKWSVAWDGDNGYKQILAHYYTGIDILDGGGNPVAPDDRWNLLWHNNFLTFPQSYCFA